MTAFDVRILGTGIVSRAIALTLAHQGLRVALQPRAAAGPDAPEDVRTYALNAGSVALLRQLRAWDALPAEARTAVHDMRVAGDGPGGHIEFSAWAQAVPELAWIVDAAALEQVLDAAARFAPGITLDAPRDGAADATPLTLIAEGKASAERERLGVRFERHGYGHHAVAARLVSDQPHAGVAHQWFRSPDVLALLPFDRPEVGHSFGLVWSLPEAEARHWQQAPVADFEDALAAATGGVAGRLRLASERMRWPLSLAHADAVCGPGWALLGDAAHLVHPLAGQGLNLGLGDVQVLAQVIAGRESWRSLGDPVLLRRYARKRRPAVWAMSQACDGLWNLFAQEQPGLRELRNRGMGLVNQLGPLKRWLVARALDA